MLMNIDSHTRASDRQKRTKRVSTAATVDLTSIQHEEQHEDHIHQEEDEAAIINPAELLELTQTTAHRRTRAQLYLEHSLQAFHTLRPRDIPVTPITAERLSIQEFETWMSCVNKSIRNTLDARTSAPHRPTQQRPARLEILDSTNNAPRQSRSYDRWPTPPTIRQAAACWELSPSQLEASVPLAYIIRMESREIRQPQLLLVVQGRPGTGKSRVIEALLWYAFQFNASHLIGVTSYTWRAVLQLNAPYHDPESTSTMLGITVGNKLQESAAARRRAQDNLDGVRLLIIDEMSFLSLRHIDAMSTAVRVSLTALDPTTHPTVAFGGLHTAMFGDLDQHQPVAHAAHPLFHGASNPDIIRTPADQRGHHIWRQFKYVVTLSEQHRMDPTHPLAAQLYHTALFFATPGGVSRQHIEQCCDNINTKAINDINPYVPENPHVATLRNTTRVFANRQLVVRRARHLNKQLLVWRATDLMKVGDVYQPVPPIVTTLLQNIPPRDTADLASMNFYFPGIEYVFRDSPSRPPGIHKMGRVKNNKATGINIYLQDDEPLIPPHAEIHLIQPPLAIIVQPHGVVIGDACGHGIPTGSIPVRRVTRTFKLHLRQPLTIANVTYHDLVIRRTTIPLGDAYAVTDYFCQGMSFKHDRWIAHLEPPATGKFVRPSIYVLLTRFASWAWLLLLTSLWAEGDAAKREEVIARFYAAAQMEPDLATEHQRLDLLARDTCFRFVNTRLTSLYHRGSQRVALRQWHYHAQQRTRHLLHRVFHAWRQLHDTMDITD